MKLNFFTENKIPLNALINIDLLPFLDGRAIMLLLDAYLLSQGIQLDRKGIMIYEDAKIDFRFSSKKIDLRPSSNKGIGREGIINSEQVIDLFFIVSVQDEHLVLLPTIPGKNERFLCNKKEDS